MKNPLHMDPTHIRLSNLWIDPHGDKLVEGAFLAESLLEPIMDTYGPLSISYGYLSPDMSKKTVTYQDPNIPSYHRWDKGAAADICVHAWVDKSAPIFLAHEVDRQFNYSRMITYSESPYICVATQTNEGAKPRKAFYENRYEGGKGQKPLYIKKSNNPAARQAEAKKIKLPDGWEGEGYPTYHGGGKRQMHHVRVSRFSMVSDFLYSTKALSEGIANAPNLVKFGDAFFAAGEFYDQLLYALDVPKLSIVRGFESFRFNDYPLFSWKEHFAIDFKPPCNLKPDDLYEAAKAQIGFALDAVEMSKDRGTVRAIGAPLR